MAQVITQPFAQHGQGYSATLLERNDEINTKYELEIDSNEDNGNYESGNYRHDEDDEEEDENDPYAQEEFSEEDIIDERLAIAVNHILGRSGTTSYDWTSTKGCEAFVGEFDDVLGKRARSKGNILHRLIYELASRKVIKHKHLDSVLTLIVQHHPKLLEMHESADRKETPLYSAILGSRSSMVLALMEGFKSSSYDHDMMRNVLAIQTKEGKNTCLHIAFEKQLEEDAIQAMLEFADDTVLAAQNSEGFTPLHLAVHFNGGSGPRTKTVLQMLRMSNTALSIQSTSGLSIYQLHISTRMQGCVQYDADVQELNDAIEVANNSPPQKSAPRPSGKSYQVQSNRVVSSPQMMNFPAGSREQSRGSGFRSQMRDGSPALRHEYDRETFRPLVPGSYMEVSHETASDSGSINRRNTTELNQGKIRSYPRRQASIRDGDTKSKIDSDHVAHQPNRPRARNVRPPDLAIDVRKLQEKDSGDNADESALEQREKLLTDRVPRQHEQPTSASVPAVHRPGGKDIQISFDFATPMSAKFRAFKNTFGSVKFDEFLQYVYLPTVRWTDNDQADSAKNYEEEEKGRGRTDVSRIFDWLRQQKVNRIVKVIVEDYEKPAHSDSAIVAALEGFHVEVLHWLKMDLDPFTILRIGRDVRELKLRWSGSNTALRAWGDPDGLRQLKHLNKVYLELVEEELV
ncbi:hypothetical protein PG984_016632 [Apiospora sp. TS-2023a]